MYVIRIQEGSKTRPTYVRWTGKSAEWYLDILNNRPGVKATMRKVT